MKPTRAAGPLIWVLLVALGACARGQGSTSPTGVRDGAGMFSQGAIDQATRWLHEAELRSEGRWQTVIETVESLEGRAIREEALAGAKAASVRGLYLFIARDEQRAEAIPSGSAAGLFSAVEKSRVVEAIQRALARGEFDQALLDAAIEARAVILQFGVQDTAGLFSPDACVRADASLSELFDRTRRQVVIETIPSLQGRSPREVATEAAKAREVRGVYVLVARDDKKTWVEPTDSARSVYTPERARSINEALVAAFKRREFDQGLAAAVVLLTDDRIPGVGHFVLGLPAGTRHDLMIDPPLMPLPKGARSARVDSPRVLGGRSMPAGPPIAAPGDTPRSTLPPMPPMPPRPPRVEQRSIILPLLAGGAFVLGILWFVARAFRGSVVAHSSAGPTPPLARGDGPAP